MYTLQQHVTQVTFLRYFVFKILNLYFSNSSRGKYNNS